MVSDRDRNRDCYVLALRLLALALAAHRAPSCRRSSPAVTVPVAGRGGQPPGETLGLPSSNRDVCARCVCEMCVLRAA